MSEFLVDARGHHCPVPSLRLRRALENASVGDQVRLLATDPMARIDVPHLASSVGADLLEIADDNGVLSFLVQKLA